MGLTFVSNNCIAFLSAIFNSKEFYLVLLFRIEREVPVPIQLAEMSTSGGTRKRPSICWNSKKKKEKLQILQAENTDPLAKAPLNYHFLLEALVEENMECTSSHLMGKFADI